MYLAPNLSGSAPLLLIGFAFLQCGPSDLGRESIYLPTIFLSLLSTCFVYPRKSRALLVGCSLVLVGHPQAVGTDPARGYCDTPARRSAHLLIPLPAVFPDELPKAAIIAAKQSRCGAILCCRLVRPVEVEPLQQFGEGTPVW